MRERDQLFGPEGTCNLNSALFSIKERKTQSARDLQSKLREPAMHMLLERKMDPSKRQLLQQALTKAVAHNLLIAVRTAKGESVLLRPDFTCYENHVEGTSQEGELITLTYTDIVSVDVGQRDAL